MLEEFSMQIITGGFGIQTKCYEPSCDRAVAPYQVSLQSVSGVDISAMLPAAGGVCVGQMSG